MENVIVPLVVALITGGPLWMSVRRNVGSKNGHGPANAAIGALHEKVDLVLERQDSHAELDEARFDAVRARLDKLEGR